MLYFETSLLCNDSRPHIYDQFSLDELNLSLCQLDNQGNNTTVWLAGDFNAPALTGKQ